MFSDIFHRLNLSFLISFDLFMAKNVPRVFSQDHRRLSPGKEKAEHVRRNFFHDLSCILRQILVLKDNSATGGTS
jgi:hypothetical protein